MRNRCTPSNGRNAQSGVVLFIALMLLLILSLIGVTVARMQTVEERMARNEHSHQIGVQHAEAALRSAEGGLLSGIYTNFAQNGNGLYDLTAANGSEADIIDWTAAGSYLTYAGPAMNAVPTAQPPEFIIENLPPVAVPGDSITAIQYAAPTPPVTVYRITAYATGADQASPTTVQSIFR
jgi:type IV pilus assembly protein PilX